MPSGATVGGNLRVTSRWSPRSIPGLVGWWDASDLDSLTVDGSGYVSQWNDLSGAGRHLTQGTGDKQPRSGTRTQNGRNVLDLNNDWLERASFTLAQPFTWFLTLNRDYPTPDGWDRFTSSSGWNCVVGCYGSDTNWTWTADGIKGIRGGVQSTAPTVLTVVANGASTTLLKDGATIASGDGGSTGFSGSLWIGGIEGTAAGMDGLLAEVLLYSGAPDRVTVESYLMSKWGI